MNVLFFYEDMRCVFWIWSGCELLFFGYENLVVIYYLVFVEVYWWDIRFS